MDILNQSNCQRIPSIGLVNSSSNISESDYVVIDFRNLNNIEPIVCGQSQSAWVRSRFQIKRLLSQFNSWKPLCLLAGLCLSCLWGVVHAVEPIITTRAYTGVPFGVGEVTIQYPLEAAPEWHTDQLARIVSADHEQLNYPAFSVIFAPGRNNCKVLRMTFLFTGTKERRIQVHAIEPIFAVVTPLEDANAHQLLMKEWWISYNAMGVGKERLDSAPCLQLQDYLRTMLARRINLKSLGQYPWPMLWPSPVFRIDCLGLLTDAASIREIQKQRMLATSTPQEPIDRPLPTAKALPARSLPENLLPDTAVEAIALRVPAECFYARCQRFDNYTWLRDSVDAWGGTIDYLVGQESYDYDLRSTIDRRLAISLNADTQKLLDESISDLAIIGTDLFFRNGPSIGVLLEAKDDRTLADVIRLQRDAVRSEPGAWEREIHLGDHTAQLLTTSDGAVRSIYAVSGKYHLITTSSFIAQKFLACVQGEGSIGSLDEFRYARQKMPLSRDDQAFVYLSDPFFRLLSGPAYQVEIKRRAAALADLQLVEMARLAAASEGKSLPAIDLLSDAGFLPKGFGPRAEGSTAQIVNGRARDSLRGTACGMLPIPDVKIEGVTLSESESYSKFALEYEQQWRQMDPVAVAIARKPNGRLDRETIVIDFVITPDAKSSYPYIYPYMPQSLNYLAVLLKPTSKRLSTEEDLLAVLEGALALDSTVFAGFKDIAPPQFRVERCKIVPETQLPDAKVPATDLMVLPFCGIAAESVGVMNLYLKNLFFSGADLATEYRGKSDHHGYVEVSEPISSIMGQGNVMFRCCRFQKGMTTIGKNLKDLEKLTPGLKLVDADRPASLRFRMRDLHGTQVGRLIDTATYLGLRRLSGANANLLWQFDQQFLLPPDKIAAAARSTIGGQPLCPLGGEYTLRTEKSASSLWVSSAWESDSLAKVDRVPEKYRFPFTTRMRELNIDLLIDTKLLSTHVEVIWQH